MRTAPDLEVGRCGKDRTVRPRSRAPIEGGWRRGSAPLPATGSFSPGGFSAPGPQGAWRGAAHQEGGPRVLGLLCPLPLMRPLGDGRHRLQTDRQRYPRSPGWAPPLVVRGVCVALSFAWRLPSCRFAWRLRSAMVPPHLLVGPRSAPAPHMYTPGHLGSSTTWFIPLASPRPPGRHGECLSLVR